MYLLFIVVCIFIYHPSCLIHVGFYLTQTCIELGTGHKVWGGGGAMKIEGWVMNFSSHK